MINCFTAEEEYANSPYSPKFEYLKTLVIGRTQGIVAFEDALKQIIALYPNDPVKGKAEEMLEYINDQKPEPVQEGPPSKYKFVKEDPHKCIIIVDKTVDMTELKITVSNFNSTYFSTEDLNITNLPLTQEKQMVVIAGIKNQAKSMAYYNAIKDDPQVIMKSGAQPTPFAISADNYLVFFKDKDIEEYESFFNSKYVKK
ncbi:MAG: hypothetical protein H0X62_12615 [Bacteroidetes bacterium]|nr:hypothetical protein [Bacteroidota bacterium]